MKATYYGDGFLLPTVALVPTCRTAVYCHCLPAYRGFGTYLSYRSVLYVGYVLREWILAAYRGFGTYLWYCLAAYRVPTCRTAVYCTLGYCS